jgi:hypothetical protein
VKRKKLTHSKGEGDQKRKRKSFTHFKKGEEDQRERDCPPIPKEREVGKHIYK